MVSLSVYARALFEVSSTNSLDFYDSILNFESLLKDSEVFAALTRTYADPKVLDSMWDVLDYEPEVISLLKIMQQSRLLRDFSRFVKEYRDLLIEHKLLVSVDVVSAVEIVNLKELEDSIANRYTGRIEMNTSVDPQLIKGMVLKVNHDVFDTSIKKRLDSVLKEAG